MDVRNNRQVLAWAFYDWANSAYATVVMAGFFPIFFRDYWSAGESSTAITLHLGAANSISSLIIVLMAPALGAIADRGGARKRFLFMFAALGIVMTLGLFWVQQGQWELAVIIYVLATLGFMGGNVFYDALLVSVASQERYETTSSFGYALGYLSGGLIFAFCVLMSLYPHSFGLRDATQAVQFSFILVAVWWAVFSIPLFLWVHENVDDAETSWREAVSGGITQLRDTFRHIRTLRTVVLFLLAYWLYIDGVDTIVRMAVDYGRALGFGRNELILALLITQFVGFPAAILFGQLGKRLGARKGIFIAIGVYIGVTIWAVTMKSAWEFYGLAVTIGLVQGGIQALSRAYYARLIPRNKAAEFFGFYNMLGKFAAVIGPVMVGWIGAITHSPRIGMLSLLVLFILGAGLLAMVEPENLDIDST